MATSPTSFTVDGHEIPLILHRNKRAKRLTMRLLETEQAIKLTIPAGCSTSHALSFLDEKRVWIANHLHFLAPKTSIKNGISLPILGAEYSIKHVANRRITTSFEGEHLLVGGLEDNISLRVVRFLKQEMKTYSQQQAICFADKIGASHLLNNITMRETSSRWGSCSSSGNISLCWRLIFAPKPVLDYVILHEVCHLKEMNHSPRFWQLLETHMPDYKKYMIWLKKNGHQLWQYQA